MPWANPKTNFTPDDYVAPWHINRYVSCITYLHDEIVDRGGSFFMYPDISAISTDYSTVLVGGDFERIEMALFRCAQAVCASPLNCPVNYFPRYKAYGILGTARTPDCYRLNDIGRAIINIYNFLQT